MADPRTTPRCEVTVASGVPEAVLASLRTRFDHVCASAERTRLVVTGLDQAGIRALLTALWDHGLGVDAMSTSSTPAT